MVIVLDFKSFQQQHHRTVGMAGGREYTGRLGVRIWVVVKIMVPFGSLLLYGT